MYVFIYICTHTDTHAYIHLTCSRMSRLICLPKPKSAVCNFFLQNFCVNKISISSLEYVYLFTHVYAYLDSLNINVLLNIYIYLNLSISMHVYLFFISTFLHTYTHIHTCYINISHIYMHNTNKLITYFYACTSNRGDRVGRAFD
jgi:hypothetical protein